MSYVAAALIVAGSTLVGSAMSSNASNSAAAVQAGAANQASTNSMSMFNTINQQNSPYRQAGNSALSQIMGMTAGDYVAPTMSGGQAGYDAALKAYNLPSSSSGSRLGGLFNNTNTGTAPVLSDYIGSGTQGNNTLTHQFNASDLNSNLAPNYQFQLQQGLGATANAANLQTGLVSGNAMMAGDQYAQNFAGNAYQNAFQNYYSGQNNIFNRLSSIAGVGQVSNQLTANAGTSATASANNYLTGGAAATAAGRVGSANAYSQGLGSASNAYLLSQIMTNGGP